MVLSIENEIFRRGLPEKLRFLDLSQLIPPASPEENLQKPFLAYVFCQCFLICWRNIWDICRSRRIPHYTSEAPFSEIQAKYQPSNFDVHICF